MSPEVKAIFSLIFFILVALTAAGTIISGSIPPVFGSIVGIVIAVRVAKFIAKKRRGF